MGVADLSFTQTPRPSPTAAPVASPAPATDPMPAVAALTPAGASTALQTPAAPPPASPVVVNLQVDGTTLATAVHRADRDTATRSFSPVPAY